MEGASGVFLFEAGVLLIHRHGYWLRNPDFRRFIRWDDPPGAASIDYQAALAALEIGELRTDDEEAWKVLHLAASLSSTHSIYLREMVEGLEQDTVRYVAEAIMYADGFLESKAELA